jgi:hypothetical protein
MLSQVFEVMRIRFDSFRRADMNPEPPLCAVPPRGAPHQDADCQTGGIGHPGVRAENGRHPMNSASVRDRIAGELDGVPFAA